MADVRLQTGRFIPDFCSSRTLWLLIVSIELMAMMLCLFEQSWRRLDWQRLALISLFMQWVGLCSAAGLCVLKRRLSSWSVWAATWASCSLIAGLSLVLSLCAVWLQLTELGSRRPWDFVLNNLLLSLLIGLILLRYFYLREQGLERSRSDAEARLNALQARIEPHFLFNSLNTLACLIRLDPVKAEALVEDLSDLFRANLQQAGTLARLDEELELARRYLQIESYRLGPRLQVEWDLHDLPNNAEIPLLTLQPLLENAVHHGIAPLLSGGCLRIHGRRLGRRIEFRIENPCLPGAREAGHGIAQENVRARLQLLFGEECRFVQEALPGKYRVWLSFSYRERE